MIGSTTAGRLWIAAALIANASFWSVACGVEPHTTTVVGAALSAPPARPQLLYVSVASDSTFHHVAVASLGAPAAGAFVTPLLCERVYVNGPHGVCLTSSLEGTTTTWAGTVFNQQFEPLTRVPLSGEPSRVRVSPDGALAAATVFETGHSYADHTFSTKTTLTQLPSGVSLGDLEQFSAFKDGRPIRDVDFNYWGVSFAADSDTFYATLDTRGVSYLVRGSVRARRLEVIHEGVECPSISPDNTRVAFKKQVGARSLGWWQIAVLQLDTMQESVVTTETRSVDDQVEWLDNDRVIYHLSGGDHAADLWTVRVDSSTKPELLVPAAYSPAVVR